MDARYSSTVLKRRLVLGSAFAVLSAGFAACDQSRPTSPTSPDARVANAPDVLPSRLQVPSPRRSLQPATPRMSMTADASSACKSILVYDNNTRYGHARQALSGMSLSFTQADQNDFVAQLTAQRWDLVVMDLPSNEPVGDWQTQLASYLGAGGRVIHTHWNPTSLTATLQQAFEITNPVAHNTQSFYQWNRHTLFTSPNAVPAAFTSWEDVWGLNGFSVDPTGTAVAAAGFTESPASGQAAIVIGNDGRSVFNGFLFDDFNSADLDSDGQSDIEELIQNEVVLACGAAIEVSKDVPPGEAATLTLAQGGEPVAGISIPAGTFTEAVTLTVRFISTDQSAPCHDYLLGQIGKCLQITATTAGGEKAINQQPMVAGLCLPAGVSAHELFKFEDRQGTPVALRQTMAPFLDCDGFQVGSAAPNGSLKGLALGIVEKVGRWLSPTPLYAAHGGFGGQISLGDGLSFFTWASPLQVSQAGIAINAFNLGKDAYALTGTFNLQPKNFEPYSSEGGFTVATDPVTVSFNGNSYTIPAGSFRYSTLLRRWVYASKSTSGITAMSFETTTGAFSVAATVPTGGPLPISKSFTVQIGHRTQGLMLVCGTNGVCVPQEPPL